jgi:hypothetical protein
VARYTRAYDPVYTPALINNSANTNTAQLYAATGTIDLSWTKPLPSDPCQAITNKLYFGTDNPPTTEITLGSNTDNFKNGIAIEKFKTYYWKVDSYDPNTMVETPGDVWTFNTNNIAPISSAESSPQRIYLVSGAASITLHGSAQDDGYGDPTPPTLTFTWQQVDTTDVLPGPVNTADVKLDFTSAITRTFRLTCSDGAATGPAYDVEVRCFENGCLAGRDATGTTVGDLQTTPDCMVNFKDFAIFASNWNTCKNYDGICP